MKKQIIEDDGKPQKHEKLINIEKLLAHTRKLKELCHITLLQEKGRKITFID
jgi:hypothetical protein